MIRSQSQFTIRAITEQDRQGLVNLVHFERYLHRHLDWRAPVDWIGGNTFYVAEQSGKLTGALACPPDPAGVAWIRLFVASAGLSTEAVWKALWARASQQLAEFDRSMVVAAIPLSMWFRAILENGGFALVDRVAVLLWDASRVLAEAQTFEYNIRLMKPQDLQAVELVDHLAFSPLWQFSASGLRAGFQDSAFATVVETTKGVIAYQISTPTSFGGHLARLAVHPDYQNKGIGRALLQNVLKEFKKREARNVTVNTQISNSPSLRLYEKAGFYRTGEEYPVYQYRFVIT